MKNLGDFLIVQVKGSRVYVRSGLSFWLDSNHYFHLKYASGKDNRVELYALWVLLKAAEERGLEHFQVFGDSKLMRDWTNQQCSIGNLGLNAIMNQVKESIDTFRSISFTHVYCEFNTQSYFFNQISLDHVGGYSTFQLVYRGDTFILE